MKQLIVPVFLSIALLFGACCNKLQQPKNVILIVGDGMGVAQVYASVVAEKADNSAFLRFPSAASRAPIR